MKWLKRLPMLVVMVVALCLTSVPAYAHEVPDASRRGTISVTMAYDGARVPGGSVTLYRVGDVVSDDGNYIFTLTSECAASGVSLDDLERGFLRNCTGIFVIGTVVRSISGIILWNIPGSVVDKIIDDIFRIIAGNGIRLIFGRYRVIIAGHGTFFRFRDYDTFIAGHGILRWTDFSRLRKPC